MNIYVGALQQTVTRWIKFCSGLKKIYYDIQEFSIDDIDIDTDAG